MECTEAGAAAAEGLSHFGCEEGLCNLCRSYDIGHCREFDRQAWCDIEYEDDPVPANQLSPPPGPTTERKKPAQDATGEDGAVVDARDTSPAHSTGVASWDEVALREEISEALELYRRAAAQAKFALAADLSRCTEEESFPGQSALVDRALVAMRALGVRCGRAPDVHGVKPTKKPKAKRPKEKKK